METNFVILKAPCQKEIIDQLTEIQKNALICSCPFYSLAQSIYSDHRINFELEWWNNNPDTVFVIAQTGSSITGFAQGFKVYSNEAPGFLRGIGAREMCGDEYFYLETVAVSPWRQKEGIGKKLVEQIVEIQTCQKVLLMGIRDSAMFRLIIKMGGEIASTFNWGTGCFMTLPAKK